MSKFNLIAVAVAAALASPAAFALNVTPVTPDVLPSNAFVDNTVSFSNGAAIQIKADATDNYLGRTTGYNIRVTLGGGAKFSAAVTAAGVTALGTAGATITLAGGGAVGDTSVTFTVTPGGAVVQGDGISVNAGTFALNNLASLGSGGTQTIDVRVGDPVGGGQLAAKNGTTTATAKQYWVVTYAAPGSTTPRIDVGSASAKKKFSSSGTVNTTQTQLFNAGQVSIAAATGITQAMGMDAAVATAPLVLSGGDFSAFASGTGAVFLHSLAACTGGTTIAATVATSNLTAAIPATTTVNALNAAPYVCFNANGTTEIAAQSLGGTVTVKQTNKLDAPAATEAAQFLDMAYNGAVKNVWHFNPSSNLSQESYLRITNSSTTSGLFTIDSTCDDATAGTKVTFNLAAGRSLLLTSKDIEQGSAAKGLTGSAGACTANSTSGVTAKRRLVITGEVGTMQVQSFLRNNSSSGSINVNINNQD